MTDKSIFTNALVFGGNIIVVSDGKLFTYRVVPDMDFLSEVIQNIINKGVNIFMDQVNPGIEAIRGSRAFVYTDLYGTVREPSIYIIAVIPMRNGAALVQCYGVSGCPQMLDTWNLVYEEVMYADTPTQSHKPASVGHILSHLKLLGVER